MDRPVLPQWLSEAVEMMKVAAGVGAILGRWIEPFKLQINQVVGRELGHDEPLPMVAADRLRDAQDHNDRLERDGKCRQSLNTLIGNGRWVEAPRRRARPAPRASQAYTPSAQRLEEENRFVQECLARERAEEKQKLGMNDEQYAAWRQARMDRFLEERRRWKETHDPERGLTSMGQLCRNYLASIAPEPQPAQVPLALPAPEPTLAELALGLFGSL